MAKFATAIRGYQKKEVEAYCEAQEAGYRRSLAFAEKRIYVLAEENKRLKEELDELKKQNVATEQDKVAEAAFLRTEIINERINAVWVKLERKLRECNDRDTLAEIAEAQGFFIGAKASLSSLLKEEFGLDLGRDGPDGDEAFERIRRQAAYSWLK